MSKLTDWMNKKVKKFDWLDMGCTKWGVLFFALFLAKVWPGILGLDWYWYLILFVVLIIRPMITIFKK